jgi:hypothetical protein
MKSIIGMFFIFIVSGAILMSGVVDFLAQESLFYILLGIIVFLFIVAFFILGFPFKKKQGGPNE